MSHPESPSEQLPRGTVTFLLTRVAGSAILWERDGNAMAIAVNRCMALQAEAVGNRGGTLYKRIGDETQSAFATAPSAVAAALDAQRALHAESWPDPPGSIEVCMALHVGEAQPHAGDYLAAPLNRLARLLALADGGQVLMTEAVEQLVRGALPPGATLRDLGEVELRDLVRHEQVYALAHPDLPRNTTQLQTTGRSVSGFPATLTPFVGREAEIEAITALIASPDVHLVTLTGPGGTGKTRLALRVGERLAPTFANGATFVDLAPLREPDRVLPAIAAALGLRETAGATLVQRIHGFLAERRTLLVLDNFEHLLSAAPAIASLFSVPEVEALVTSRAALRLQAEHEFPVPSLRLPRAEDRQNRDALATNEAVALFVSRAQAVQSGFALGAENASVIAEICARLDGLPLAIELAAARLKVLPPRELLNRLEQRLSLLTGGPRDAPARQRTLRATVSWSYDLLPPDECRLFRRLGVFVGGWTFEAGEAVANAVGDLDVLSELTSLVENSLVTADLSGDDPRYGMLGAIREFALERLVDAGEADEVFANHAAFYCAFAERVEPELVRAGQRSWLNRLAIESANIITALTWLLDHDEVEKGLRLALAMRFYWFRRAPLTEGSRWFSAFLERPLGEVAPRVRAQALAAAGTFSHLRGDEAKALPLYQDALVYFREVNDLVGEARALRNLASLSIDLGELHDAEQLLAESQRVAAASGNPRSVADALGLLGMLAFARREPATAATHLVDATNRFRLIGDVASVMDGTGDAGYMKLLQGDSVSAASLVGESLSLATQLDAQDRVSWAILCAGNLAAAAGLLVQAVRLLARADAMREVLGEDLRPAVVEDQERLVEELRKQLGEPAFTAAREEGRALSVAAAVAASHEVISTMTESTVRSL